MPWPLSQDYNEAIQSPESSFSDPELKQGEAKTNAIGLPMPRSGNFADVYEFHCPTTNRKWAVKCFTREVPGLRERYSEISAYLQQAKLPFMVDFTYLDPGIKVRGQWFPVLKMHWVEGFTLNEFVNKNADQPAYLDMLGQIWVRMCRRLREARMAHCDLQHGNVLLVPGSTAKSLGVRLIDYDGMCVPALAQKKSGEIGHPAYQHPQRLREGTYSVEVDRFPHLVIYTALRSLMVGSRYLWNRHDNGDNLLFRQQDLNDPAHSALFEELRRVKDPEVQRLVDVLSQAAQKPLEQTPWLDELVTEKQAIMSAVTRRAKAASEPVPSVTMPQAEFAALSEETGSPAAGYPRRKKSSLLRWVAGVLVMMCLIGGLAAGGAWIALQRSNKGSKNEIASATVRDAAVSKTAATTTTVPERKPATKPEPKPEPRPVTEPKPVVPMTEPKIETKPIPLPPAGQAALSLEGHKGLVLSVAFSPDGKRVVSGSGDRTLKVWDAQSGQEERILQGHIGGIVSVTFSHDGRRIISGCNRGTVKVWDVQNGQEQLSLHGHMEAVNSVAISPDDKHIVSASMDQTLKIWDARTGQEERTLKGHMAWVTSVAISPDGRHIVSGSVNRELKVWDAQTGQVERTLKGHNSLVSGTAFTPDGKHIVSGSEDRTLKVWDVQSGQEIRTLQGHTAQVNRIAISPDGKRIVSVSNDQTLKVWDLQTGQEERTLTGHTSAVRSAAFSPDGKRIVSGSNDRTVKVWNLPEAVAGRPEPKPEPQPAPREVRQFRDDPSPVLSVSFSEDGRCALSVLSTVNVLWDATDGKRKGRVVISNGEAVGGAMSPSGRNCVVCYPKVFVVLDLYAPRLVREVVGDGTTFRCMTISPDGRHVLVGMGDPAPPGQARGENCFVRIWNMETGQEVRRFAAHGQPVTHLAVSPDGGRVLSGSKDLLCVWEMETGKEVRRLSKVPSYAAMSVLPGGNQLLLAGTDRIMRLWNLDTDGEVRRFAPIPTAIASLAVSRDGRFALTGSGRQIAPNGQPEDCFVRLWDLNTGKEVHRFEGHTNVVRSVAFAPDGQLALSGGDDTMRLWQLPNSATARLTPNPKVVPKELSELVVEALIDGDSELHVTKDGIYWVSLGVAKPGRHDGRNEPTYVNGEPWNPIWGDPTQDRGHDKTQLLPLPIQRVEFALEVLAIGKVRGTPGIDKRDPVTARMSQGKLIITIPDRQVDSRWYKLRLYRK